MVIVSRIPAGVAFTALLVALASPGQSLQAQSAVDPIRVIRRAVDAIGGEAVLRGITTVVAEFNSASFGLGQEETPFSPARGPVASGRIVTDWQRGRRLFTQEVRQVTGVVTRQRRITADSIGMIETNGTQAADPAGVVASTLQGMELQPERMLLRGLAAPGAVTALPPRSWRGEEMDGVRLAQGRDTVSLYFDRLTGLLTVAEIMTDDPVLGDRHNVTWYTRWQDAGGGVKLPRQFDSEANGRLLSQNIVTAIQVNQPAADSLFAIPDSIVRRASRASGAALPVTVQLVELAPGVWRAEGGSHHSLVVDGDDGLIVVEAPQNAARSLAVLDSLKSRFPNKRVSVVVNTHHHWDHSGGLRAYMARGIPVVTHQRNVAFVRGIATATKTLAPDELSRSKRSPVIRAVTDSVVLGSGERRVVLYQLPSTHVEGILAAYVPAARILFTSDVLSPGPTLAQAGSAEIVAFAHARGLTVDRFAGGHGGVASWGDVEKAAK